MDNWNIKSKEEFVGYLIKDAHARFYDAKVSGRITSQEYWYLYDDLCTMAEHFLGVKVKKNVIEDEDEKEIALALQRLYGYTADKAVQIVDDYSPLLLITGWLWSAEQWAEKLDQLIREGISPDEHKRAIRFLHSEKQGK